MATPNSSIELTARGKVVLWLGCLAAGAAWLGGDGDARLAAAILAAPLLIDFVAKQRHLHFTKIKVTPRRTVAGAVFFESVEVEHHGRRPLRSCLVHEPRFMRGEPPALLPTMQPFTPANIEMRQRSHVRSHVLERVFLIESQWPLGMFTTRSVVSCQSDLITEPARIPIRASVLDAAMDAEAAPVDRSALPGPEFQSLREHLPEEDARGVHALRSAALGTLIRRVTRGRLPRTVGIVLDLRRPPRQVQQRGKRNFEWSLGACATLSEELHKRGCGMRVVVIDADTEQMEVKDGAQLITLLTVLSEASISNHRIIKPNQLDFLDTLAHCYWIPAGGYTTPPELAGLERDTTLITKDVG